MIPASAALNFYLMNAPNHCRGIIAGTDVTIVTFSRMVGYSLEAAKALEKEGISVEVINLRCDRLAHSADGVSHFISRPCRKEGKTDRRMHIGSNLTNHHVCLSTNRTLRPLDTKTVLDSVRKTSRLVTVEEGWPQCGTFVVASGTY